MPKRNRAKTRAKALKRWRNGIATFAIAGAIALPATSANAEKVLRVAMTAADIPINIGQPDQGFEGFRFMGYMLYDTLVAWDLSKADVSAGLTPGLAESWSTDPKNPERWIFKLRKGVKFHDGSDFTADDVVWNFQKVRDTNAKHYEPKQAALVAVRIPALKAVNKIDDYTVEILTKGVSAYVPYQVSFGLCRAKSNTKNSAAGQPSLNHLLAPVRGNLLAKHHELKSRWLQIRVTGTQSGYRRLTA